MNAVRLESVVKRYSGFQLGPLDLELTPGRVVAYVGPNGSGKTTTMHCLTGMLALDSGSIELFGRKAVAADPQWKRDIGYVGGVQPFFERFTGERNLAFLAKFHPELSSPRVVELARKFRLPLDKPVAQLSRGNRVKLALVSVLARSPRLLLLDEPTAGLDPVVRDEVLESLYDVVERGEPSILYSTHILTDIARLADEIVFLVDGRIQQCAHTEDLTDRWRRISFRLSSDPARLPAVARHRQDGSEHQVITADGPVTLEQLRELGAENIRETRMSIDEIAVQILRGNDHASNSAS